MEYEKNGMKKRRKIKLLTKEKKFYPRNKKKKTQ